MGTVLELPLSRRVQLAVVAHIRHVYTDYDKLLKTGTYQNARAAVEKPCLDLLARWRSDDDDDPNAMEEILREVIVIDDDEDEIKDSKSSLGNPESFNREGSIEFISSHALADEVQVHQMDYGGPAEPVRGDQPYSPEPEDRAVVRHSDVGQLRIKHHPRSDISTLERNGVHHHRWQEALDRHRTNLVPIHSGKHELLVQKSAVPSRGSMFYTEVEPRQLRLEGHAGEFLPVETRKIRNLGSFDPKGKENIPWERLEFADRSLHPDPDPARLREVSTVYLIEIVPKILLSDTLMRLQAVLGLAKPQQVVLPAEAHLQNSRVSLTEPMSSQRFWKNGKLYSHDGYLEQPRNTSLEENVAEMRDRSSQQDLIGSTHNYLPRDIIHRTPGQILRSVESNNFETTNFKDASNIPQNGHLHEFNRIDRGAGFEPEVVHVNGDIESHNKRRRGEDLVPFSSESYRQRNVRSYPDRTVLIPLSRDDDWGESHEQLSPATPLSTVNPFIRRNPSAYIRPVEAMNHADRETISRAVPYEASSPSRGPTRAFENAEALHLRSHSAHKLPAGSRQVGDDSLFSTFEAPEKASLIFPFRDERMFRQISHVPVTSSNSSYDAFDHPPLELRNRRFIDPLERRTSGRQEYEQELYSDFARLQTGSRHDSRHSKPSIDGFEDHRRTLVQAHRGRSPSPLREESGTCIFLRKLPDETHTRRNNAKPSSSMTRSIYEVNQVPHSDSDRFRPLGAEPRASQTWTPVREKVQVNSWQPYSRLANDQR